MRPVILRHRTAVRLLAVLLAASVLICCDLAAHELSRHEHHDGPDGACVVILAIGLLAPALVGVATLLRIRRTRWWPLLPLASAVTRRVTAPRPAARAGPAQLFVLRI